jgi:hypothetical protein
MENLHVSNLVRSSINHIRSEAVLGPAAGYQEALFTLAPDRISTPDPLDIRQILVVSFDEDSIEGEGPEAGNLLTQPQP